MSNNKSKEPNHFIGKFLILFLFFVISMTIIGLYGDKVERDIVVLSNHFNFKQAGKVAGMEVQKSLANLVIDNGNSRLTYDFDLVGNEKAFDLLDRVALRQNMVVEAKYYQGLGRLVESINGVKNGDNNGAYWSFFVNGQMATVGMDSYQVKPGDVIELKFIKM